MGAQLSNILGSAAASVGPTNVVGAAGSQAVPTFGAPGTLGGNLGDLSSIFNSLGFPGRRGGPEGGQQTPMAQQNQPMPAGLLAPPPAGQVYFPQPLQLHPLSGIQPRKLLG